MSVKNALTLVDDTTPLLNSQDRSHQSQNGWEAGKLDAQITKEERALGGSTIGERLSYNEYTTIDWLHDLVKDSYRHRLVHNVKGLRGRVLENLDACSGWIAVAVMGTLTACVAFIVDICEATVSDWKTGYCSENILMDYAACCKHKERLVSSSGFANSKDNCPAWHPWTQGWWQQFGTYGGFALAFGVISATATRFTRMPLSSASPGKGDKVGDAGSTPKVFSMAAGSGIPEIKTFLSGFEIPHLFDLKVLFVKAFGSIFAVATGMCLGKEGPFVHISACVGYQIAILFPKYRDNARMIREIMAAAVAAGLSVAFGAPIGGVLFSYEEVSTYFPRKILWRAFLCSLFSAIVLKMLNPTGTGKLVLFETDHGSQYLASHYFVFILLGLAGGIWGGLFCKLNFLWSKWFRAFPLIKNYPIFEVFLVVLLTVLLQYPNPMTRESGDAIIRHLVVNCDGNKSDTVSFVCRNEARQETPWPFIGWLILGCIAKLVLTIVTFGAKVPSGVIIPALGAGAFFGRLVGQTIDSISPGVFAMVGAAAFLAGVSRMTISLCVIMFELTGELEYTVPHMVAILVAKWTADALSAEGVYDLAQSVLGHPFLDLDVMVKPVQLQDPPHLVKRLIPPRRTMNEITVEVGTDNKVNRGVLQTKLEQLQNRGLLDAGLVLVQNEMLQGYLGEAELAFGLNELGKVHPLECKVRLLGDTVNRIGQETWDDLNQYDSLDSHYEGGVEFDNGVDPNSTRRNSAFQAAIAGEDDLNLAPFVDRTPLCLSEAAPMEYAVECFGKLGLRHLMITEEGTGKLIGVCLKKRMLAYLEGLEKD